MSFMSVPALDSLLEPERGSSKVQPATSSGMDRERVVVQNRSMPFYPSYPYSSQPTPSPTRPRTPSPSSFSPSPYVLNFKRRVSGSSTSNGKSVAPVSDISPAATSQQTTISGAHDGSSSSSSSSSSSTQPKNDAAINSVSRENSASTMLRQKNKTVNGKITVSDEGLLPVGAIRDRLRVAGKILDGQDGFPARSNGRKFTVKVDANGDGLWNDESGKWVRSNSSSSSSSSRPLSHQESGAPSHLPLNGEEFFDAPEAPLDEYTSDEEGFHSGQRSARSSMSMRDDSDANLEWKLDQEIKRRIAAEDAMAVLQQQCNEMVSRLPYVDEEGNVLVDDLQTDWDNAHQAQRIVVAREVAASVARGAVKAELEEELETVVAEKNREVARLRDKLQYFELVNHEMSQRNQEAIEIARRSRHRRQNRNRWLLGCAGAAVVVGVSAALVYQYVPWGSIRVRARNAISGDARYDWNEIHESPSHDT